MSVTRHTRKKSDDIMDTEIKTVDLEDKSVTRAKQQIITQGGTASPPYTAGYQAFPEAFAASAEVVATALSNLQTYLRVPSTSSGSFSWEGSPSGVARWLARGSKA